MGGHWKYLWELNAQVLLDMIRQETSNDVCIAFMINLTTHGYTNPESKALKVNFPLIS